MKTYECQVFLCDLVGMTKWPELKGSITNLQLGDQKVTLNQLVYDYSQNPNAGHHASMCKTTIYENHHLRGGSSVTFDIVPWKTKKSIVHLQNYCWIKVGMLILIGKDEPLLDMVHPSAFFWLRRINWLITLFSNPCSVPFVTPQKANMEPENAPFGKGEPPTNHQFVICGFHVRFQGKYSRSLLKWLFLGGEVGSVLRFERFQHLGSWQPGGCEFGRPAYSRCLLLESHD